MTNNHPPEHQLSWRDNGTPVSTQFDDPFFSLDNGLAETRHVFLAGNDLPARLGDGFHVAELGFGTGLSLLTLWQAWEDTGRPGQIHFTSFEAFPLSRDQLARALSAFPELAKKAAQLCAAWPLENADLGSISVSIIGGDARQSLPAWGGDADAWFLDGFSPAKNPELWEPELMQAVHDHTRPGGTVATYTAAGFVRRGLAAAGFEVTRAPGFGRKRHMTIGAKP